MKKFISTLLVVTMLLSMVVMAVPAFAEEPADLTVYNSANPYDPYKAWEKYIEEDQETNAATLAADTDYTAIEDEEDLLAMEEDKKYYLANDITVSTVQTVTDSGVDSKTILGKDALANGTLDGNGHTITVDANVPLFYDGTNHTIKNLKVVNTQAVTFDRALAATNDYIAQRCGALYKSDLSGGGNFENVVVDIDVVATKHADTPANKASFTLGGFAAQISADTSTYNFTDVKYVGNIDGKDVLKNHQAHGTGAFFGQIAKGATLNFTRCITEGWIKSNREIGGFIGIINDAAKVTMTDCINNMDIKDNGGSNMTAAGFIADSLTGKTSVLKFIRCLNFGDVKINANGGENGNLAAGILAFTGYQTVIEDCKNFGDVTGARYANSGIFGMVRGGGGFHRVSGCENYGTIDGTTCKIVEPNTATRWSNPGAAGIVAYSASNCTGEVSSVTNCTNYGKIIGGTDACVGGIVGSAAAATIDSNAFGGCIKIEGCVNRGEITTAGTQRGTGGILGQFAPHAGIGAKGYLEIKDSKNYGTITFSEIPNMGKISTIVGYIGSAYTATNSKLDNCENHGDVVYTDGRKKPISGGDDVYVGTVAAGITLDIINCTNTATVTYGEVYSFLTDLIADAEEVAAANIYTHETWVPFAVALQNAQACISLGTSVPQGELVDCFLTLFNTKAALVAGGVITNEADFAKIAGSDATFTLAGNITVTKPVANFKGTLDGEGYTITTTSALFTQLEGATINNLKVVGAEVDAPLFGTANGKVTVNKVTVTATSVNGAALFADVAAEAKLTIEATTVTADTKGAGLVAAATGEVTFTKVIYVGNVAGTAGLIGKAGLVSIKGAVVLANVKSETVAYGVAEKVNDESDFYNVYFNGVLDAPTASAVAGMKVIGNGIYAYAVDANGVAVNGTTDYAVLASGEAACVVNKAFDSTVLVQTIGDDAVPTIGTVAPDGSNEVVEGTDGYENAGMTVTPVEPDAEIPVETNYKQLNSAITKAEALKAEDYTKATWDVLVAVLADAKAALASKVQAEVDLAAAKLTYTMGNLTKVEVKAPAALDFTALNAAIAAAEALKEADYTAETWAAMKTALDAAKAAKTATEQDAITAAANALNINAAGLVKKVAAPVVDTPAATEPAEDGCASVLGGTAVVLTAVLALGAGVSFKKKED